MSLKVLVLTTEKRVEGAVVRAGIGLGMEPPAERWMDAARTEKYDVCAG